TACTPLLHPLTTVASPSFCTLSSFFYSSGDHRDLHSFPTRRSSDLLAGRQTLRPCWWFRETCRIAAAACHESASVQTASAIAPKTSSPPVAAPTGAGG